MTAPTTGDDERRADEPDEASGAGPAPDRDGIPNPETGVGLGAGPPNSFEPEEAEPTAGGTPSGG